MKLDTIIDRSQELADRKDTTWDARCKAWANDGIRWWARKLPWPTLRRVDDFTFTSREATGRHLYFPQYVDKVLRIADDTNNVWLRPNANPDLDFPNKHLDNSNGAAFFFRELGLAAVHKQPSTPATLSVRTDVSDVFTVTVAGTAQDTTASGTPDEFYRVAEELSVGGSGPVTSTNLFVRVDSINKSDEESAGDLFVTTSADGQIARVNKYSHQSVYRVLELLGAPVAGTVFQVEYLLQPPALRSVNDAPPPAVDTDFLIWYTASMIHRAQGNVQEAEVFLARAQGILDREAGFEKTSGDQDFRAFPESLYWASEEQYTWPPNGGLG